jgi:hypothetical protein
MSFNYNNVRDQLLAYWNLRRKERARIVGGVDMVGRLAEFR